MYKVTSTMRGGSYDDSIVVNGFFLHGLDMRRVYRSVVDGKRVVPSDIKMHLSQFCWMPDYTNRQVSQILQRLKAKGLVQFGRHGWSEV